MVPVLNRPVMEHTFAYLKRFGIEDIVLAMNYLPEAFKGYFGDGSRCGVRLTYCIEKEPMGTAGAVKNTAECLESTFLVLNGDIFTDLKLDEMLAFHRRKKAKATISLTWVEDPSAFGVVETDENQKVKRFIEKPPRAEATTHWINAGIYILEPEVLNYIPLGTHYMFERGLFPGLLEAGEPVYGYPYRDFWLDMGTLEKYFTLNMDLLTNKVSSPFNIQGKNPKSAVKAGTPVIIGSGCRISNEVCFNGPVIIGNNCCLDKGAVVENAVLWDNVNVGPGARLKNCIITSQSVIAANREVINCIVTPMKNERLQLQEKY
jgi:mannose-1-phosphate guanylyltransferase